MDSIGVHLKVELPVYSVKLVKKHEKSNQIDWQQEESFFRRKK